MVRLRLKLGHGFWLGLTPRLGLGLRLGLRLGLKLRLRVRPYAGACREETEPQDDDDAEAAPPRDPGGGERAAEVAAVKARLHLWCHGTWYVRHTRGWYPYPYVTCSAPREQAAPCLWYA